jgi:hypothetical protein
MCEGNSVYSNSSTIVNFVVTPFEQQTVFSVTSNSTVTALYFNSTGNQLSFSTNGTSGTTGYVDIYVPKSLVADASSLKVFLDGAPLIYTATAQDDAWLVSFTYHQSSHEVTINLDSSSGLVAGNGVSQFDLIGAFAVIIALAAAVLLVWQKKRIKR